MIEHRNMILAIVLSIAIILGYEFLFPTVQPTPQVTAEQADTTDTPAAGATSDLPNAAATTSGGLPSPVVSAEVASEIAKAGRSDVLAASQRVVIHTDRLSGSISLVGGRIDDLSLLDYREELDLNSAKIILLQPRGMENAYYANFGLPVWAWKVLSCPITTPCGRPIAPPLPWARL